MAHNELLAKLWSFSILCGSLWLWIKAYLSNRLQCVSVGQSASNLLPVLSGVPQGSILGPLFFIIFVNDLPSSLLSSSIKCIMPVYPVSDCHLLQSDLARMVKWSATWKLLLNEDKCSITLFSSNQFPLTYYYSINGKFLPSKPTQRDLGVTVSSD